MKEEKQKENQYLNNDYNSKPKSFVIFSKFILLFFFTLSRSSVNAVKTSAGPSTTNEL